MLAALRNQFGGHAVKSAPAPAKKAPVKKSQANGRATKAGARTARR
jgi:hypothetical protein